MFWRRRKNPIASACVQQVTLYHMDYHPVFRCRRTVIDRAFFDTRMIGEDTVGQSGLHRRCLLVIPCGGASRQWVYPGMAVPKDENWFTLEPGDWVMEGIGPEIESFEQWQSMTVENIPQMAVIQQVSAKHWRGKIGHVEATTDWFKRW